MDRSSDFGSTLSNCTPYSDPLSLRLPETVKLATERKSLTHYTKGTRSRLRAPTVFMHAVSCSISLPSRGSFRLSLTVLVHYRSVIFFLQAEDGIRYDLVTGVQTCALPILTAERTIGRLASKSSSKTRRGCVT